MVFDKNLIYCSFAWHRCQPLTEWCVIGAEEGDLVPHLVVVVGGVPSCPFAIPRGTERHSLTVVFPAAPEVSAQQTLVMTCQQIDGQTHVLLWDQPCPQVIVHNHTHSTVMFAKANTDNASTFFITKIDWCYFAFSITFWKSNSYVVNISLLFLDYSKSVL